MKNKITAIIIVLILAFSVTACSKNATQSEGNTSSNPPTENSSGTDTINTPQPQVTKDQTAQEAKDASVDSSLKGLALLESISRERPKTMSMKMEMISFGMTTVSTVYYDGDNTRTETDVDGVGNNVLIYNADEEVTYSYVEGSGEGIILSGDDMASTVEAGMMLDMTGKFTELADASSDDVIARVETLNGEEVIYIEANDIDEEMGNVLVKMWYSAKYGTPLKYEIVVGEQTMMSLNVLEIKKDIKIEKNLFSAPGDITFREVDLGAMSDFLD